MVPVAKIYGAGSRPIWAFNVYERPLLQYVTCVWSPCSNYAIDKTESVQRKFTKRLKECKYIQGAPKK